jgi:hypothetical protein
MRGGRKGPEPMMALFPFFKKANNVLALFFSLLLLPAFSR